MCFWWRQASGCEAVLAAWQGWVVGVGCWLCRWILVWFDCWWLAHHRVAAEIRSSTTSVQEAIGGHGYDAALDCTGEAFALLPALRSGGRVVSVLALPTGENLRQLRGFKRPISCCIPCCGGCLAACFLSWCRHSTWCCCGSKSVSGLLTIPRGSDLERLAARVAELEADTQRQAQELKEAASARGTAQAEAERLAARVAELEADTQRQAQELEEAASARGTAQAEAERLAAWAAELEAETAAGVEARKAAEDRAGAFEAEARQAQQNLAVALRLQNRREADLKELQKRYSALLQRQEAQEDLLRRTGACLGYLMDDSAPEEARPVPAAAAVALRSGGA